MVRVADAAPGEDGVKVTLSGEEFPTPTTSGTGFTLVTVKLEGFAPEIPSAEICNSALPLLLTISVWAELDVPTN